jgi:hypothetical protein
MAELFTEVQPPIVCNLSNSTLELAVMKVGASFVYDVHVSEMATFDAIKMMRELGANRLLDHFSPYFNVVTDPELSGWGPWFVEANGKRYGSRGL